MSEEKNKQVVRMLTRSRESFQRARKEMDGRIGRKADGSDMKIPERLILAEDMAFFAATADDLKKLEACMERRLEKVLQREPIYADYLKHVQGVGPVAAGHIIGTIDIREATTVSKIWQYCGMNPGMVDGKKALKKKDGSYDIVLSGTRVRGDRLTPGHVAPYNKRMKTALLGVLADGFIKAGIRWEPCTEEEYAATPEGYRDRRDKKVHTEIIEWHDADEEKPDAYIAVLVQSMNGSVFESHYEGDERWVCSGGMYWFGIRYWADLPQGVSK